MITAKGKDLSGDVADCSVAEGVRIVEWDLASHYGIEKNETAFSGEHTLHGRHKEDAVQVVHAWM